MKRDNSGMKPNDAESEASEQKPDSEFASSRVDRSNLREGKWITAPNRLEDRMRQQKQ
jgi:hypothetical protein